MALLNRNMVLEIFGITMSKNIDCLITFVWLPWAGYVVSLNEQWLPITMLKSNPNGTRLQVVDYEIVEGTVSLNVLVLGIGDRKTVCSGSK